MTPRGRPGHVPIQTGAARVRTGPRECAAGRLPRSRRLGADALPGSLLGCSRFRSSVRLSLLGSAYDVSLTGHACRWRALSPARRAPPATAHVWAEVLVGPDTTGIPRR